MLKARGSTTQPPLLPFVVVCGYLFKKCVKERFCDFLQLKWQRKESILIYLVQQKPFIYNKANRLFKDERQKQSAFDEIGRSFGVTGEVCRKLWKNLRDRYVREKKKRISHSGQETEEETTWPYMRSMGFLAPFVRPRNTYTSIAPKPSCSSSDITSDSWAFDVNSQDIIEESLMNDEINNDLLTSTPEPQIEFVNIPVSSESSESGGASTPTPSDETTRKQKGKTNKVANDLIDVARNIASQIKTGPTQSDTDSAFGLYVTNRLQEMEPEVRRAKRRAIVLLLEDD